MINASHRLACSSRAAAPRPALAPRPGQQPSRRTCVRVNAEITLYTNPGSRGKIVEWYLEELKLPHKVKLLDMRAGEHKRPAFLDINPFGKVPALTDDDVKLFESGGILLYLANKYAGLNPAELGKAAQWTLFANSTLSDSFFNASQRPTQMPINLKILDSILAKSPYLTGDTFSVSDIAVGSYLLYLPLFFPDLDLTVYPAVWEYMKGISARDSCPEPYKVAMAGAIEQRQGAGAGGMMSKLFGKK